MATNSPPQEIIYMSDTEIRVFGKVVNSDPYTCKLMKATFDNHMSNVSNPQTPFKASQNKTPSTQPNDYTITFTAQNDVILHIDDDKASYRGTPIPKDSHFEDNVYNALTEWLQLLDS